MKLFTVKCESCGHIWQDINKSYLCPQCESDKTVLVDAPYEGGIFTEGGNSLIMVLTTMMIMSFLMLGITGLTVHAFKASNTAVVNSDINTYVNQIRGTLQDPTMSATALAFNDVTGTMILTDPLNGKVLAQPGYGPIGGAWKVDSITVDGKYLVRGNTYRLTLGISVIKDRAKVLGYHLQHKSLGDVYCDLAGNTITTCTGGTDLLSMAQQLCTTLGFTWNNNACSVPVNVNTNNGNH